MNALANLLKIRCDFIKGSLNPLGKESFIPTDYHGKNGLCGLILSNAENEYNGDFLKDMYEIIKKHKIYRNRTAYECSEVI